MSATKAPPLDRRSWEAGYAAALMDIKQDDQTRGTMHALGRLVERLNGPLKTAQHEAAVRGVGR